MDSSPYVMPDLPAPGGEGPCQTHASTACFCLSSCTINEMSQSGQETYRHLLGEGIHTAKVLKHSLIQISVLLGLPKLSPSAVVASSSLQARTELEKRIHPCQ